MQQVKFIDLGLIDYKQAWDYQERLFNKIIQQKIEARKTTLSSNLPTPNSQLSTPSYLIFCEHPHVYTLGKSGDEKHLLINENQLAQKQATYYKINRGGDITYHGPGQIVGYPILDLDNFFTDIHKYLRYLEEMTIRTLDEYGIKSERSKGETGVWLDAENPLKTRKICALGVRSSRWVTMHGFALNVNANLDYFNNIVPCGISDKQVTSMDKELGTTISINDVKNKLKKHFADLFNCEII